MKILFCAYRDWALKVFDTIKNHPNISDATLVNSNSELEILLKKHEPEQTIVLFCGWSSPPTKEMVDFGIEMFSEHPACSDRYSPGTPIQNQILDGITRTKHRIVKVGFPELSERKWSHEVDMDLSGNMSDILEQMTATSKVLFTRFLNDYPYDIIWNVWDEIDEKNQVPRRTESMSKLTKDDISNLSTLQLYNLIRSLESPYPNAYLEDEEGRLYFEKVRFKFK